MIGSGGAAMEQRQCAPLRNCAVITPVLDALIAVVCVGIASVIDDSDEDIWDVLCVAVF